MADGSIYEFGGTAEGEPLGRIYGYKHAYIITTPEQAKNAHYDASSKGWDWTTGTRLGTGKNLFSPSSSGSFSTLFFT